MRPERPTGMFDSTKRTRNLLICSATTPAGKYLVKSANLVTTLPNQTLVRGVDGNLRGRQSTCTLLLANGPTPAYRQSSD